VYIPHRALVTGASSGIGADLARALAARGADLILVARREDRLRRLADEFAGRHGVRVEVLPLDLAKPHAGARLHERIAGEVDTVINAAGFGSYGSLIDTDVATLESMVDTNVRALVDVTRAFLPGLIDRRGGAIVNVASTASFQPVPGQAVYAASKAFVRTFSEAIWWEARRHGVKVTALCPGVTRTEFFDVVGRQLSGGGPMQTVAQVTATALRALDRRSTPPVAISGRINGLFARGTSLVPRRALIGTAARVIGYEG
jgi:short-subunit dehydrogenase